jgi:hypothetical protein
MNQIPNEPGNRLTEVLGRIQALNRQASSDENDHQQQIPRLNEAYDGDLPLQFVVPAERYLPVLEEPAPMGSEGVSESDPVTDTEEVAAREATFTEAQREEILKEMESLIRDAVRRAVLKELVVVEKALRTTLEIDIMQALKERLESGDM